MTRRRPTRSIPARRPQRFAQLAQVPRNPPRRLRPSLEVLPSSVLVQIFDEVLEAEEIDQAAVQSLQPIKPNLSVLYLSRRLLPAAAEAVYKEVHIHTKYQYVSLYTALRRRPRLGELVKTVFSSLVDAETIEEERDGRKLVAEGPMALSRSEKRRLRREDPLREILFQAEAPFETSRYTFCGDLVRKLFDHLPNLKHLQVFSKSLLPTLFNPLLRPSFKSLNLIIFPFRIPEEDAQSFEIWPTYAKLTFELDFESDQDRDLCANLSRLPALKELEFVGNRQFMPCATSLQPSSVPLPRQSWPLEKLSFTEMNVVKDVSTVFDSLTDAFTELLIETQVFCTTFLSDLLLVPTSLTHLSLTSGPLNCGKSRPPPPLYPTLDDAVLRFTNLEYLKLSGPLISSSFWTRARSLSKLQELVIGYHLPQDGKAILALVDGPERLSKLNFVSLHVCRCPPSASADTAWTKKTGGKRQVRWSGKNGELNYTDGLQILRALKRRGIEQGGNLACAVKECDAGDPNHRCWR
ncbi:hypothetical protein JCM5350_001345 [Sporobolomyces pararoseus]